MNRDELEKTFPSLYVLYREFEEEWFPNKYIDTTLDFLLWLGRNGYEIAKKSK